MDSRLHILNLTSWHEAPIRQLILRLSRILEKRKLRVRYVDRMVIRYNGATVAESFGWYLSRSRVLTLRLPRPTAFMPAELLERIAQASTDLVMLPTHHVEWLRTDLALLLSTQENVEQLRGALSYLSEEPTPAITAPYASTQPTEAKCSEIKVRLRDLKKELQAVVREIDGDIEFQRRQIRRAEQEIDTLEQTKLKRTARIQKGIDSLTRRLSKLEKPTTRRRKATTAQ